jgi:hypothetical protein
VVVLTDDFQRGGFLQFDPATGEVGGLFVITGCGDGTL